MKKILITGKDSYIGTNFKKYLEQYSDEYYVEELDVRNKSWKEFDFSQFDVVYHVAGIAHSTPDESQREFYYKVNTDLTYEVALKAKQEWYQCHPCSLNGDWIDEPYMKNAYTANEETINRWIVNYIRHNLVSYDNFLGSIDGKVGSVEAYPEVKIAVLEKIANTYPKYKDECERQIFFVDFNADR